LHDHPHLGMENKTWFGDHGRSTFHHVASSDGLQLCQLNYKLQLEASETCTLYLGSATWRSDWSFLVVLFCTTRDMSTLFSKRNGHEACTQGTVSVGRGRGTDGLDHSSCSTRRLLRLVFFSLPLVQVAQVSTHISPLFFSVVGHCFSQPPPALRIQMGVIFVIGVNELVFFAQGRS
jgi:hypothetical protein